QCRSPIPPGFSYCSKFCSDAGTAYAQQIARQGTIKQRPASATPSVPSTRSSTLQGHAVLVCDIQEGHRHTVHHFESVVATAVRMIRLARLFSIPVFLTVLHPNIYGSTVPEVLNEYNQLGPLQGGVFTKTRYFGNVPDLHTAIKQQSITKVMICGLEAHISIQLTVFGLIPHGLGVHIILDGISSCNKEEIPVAVALMRQMGAKGERIFIATSETMAYSMMDSADESLLNSFIAMMRADKPAISSGVRNLLGGNKISFVDDSEAVD
ncbi:hypothetical protein FRC20_001299, partial [Serendipita sp. 405]